MLRIYIVISFYTWNWFPLWKTTILEKFLFLIFLLKRKMIPSRLTTHEDIVENFYGVVSLNCQAQVQVQVPGQVHKAFTIFWWHHQNQEKKFQKAKCPHTGFWSCWIESSTLDFMVELKSSANNIQCFSIHSNRILCQFCSSPITANLVCCDWLKIRTYPKICSWPK